jgi:hypothetical protein
VLREEQKSYKYPSFFHIKKSGLVNLVRLFLCLKLHVSEKFLRWDLFNPLLSRLTIIQTNKDDITDKLNVRSKFGAIMHTCEASLFFLPNLRINFIRKHQECHCRLLVTKLLIIC